MAWGGGCPSFKIHGELSYNRCKELWENGDRFRHREYGLDLNIECNKIPSRSNYWIVQVEDGYALRMYNTHILTFLRDGTCLIKHYNTGVTRDVINYFGPTYVWRHARSVFQDAIRFGGSSWGSRLNEGRGYPFSRRDALTIHPDRTVHDVIDYKRGVNPKYRVERAAIREQFRRMLPRLLLGEFGDAFLTPVQNQHLSFGRCVSGWESIVTTPRLRALFYANAEHEPIMAELDVCPRCPDSVFMSKQRAMVGLVEQMIGYELSDDRFYHLIEVPYATVTI